ncbi:MAG: hypothetical protein JKX83_04230 [Pseudomonadales bacterium]|nr:hypothetical protein [Pseudomonadales bacterium]
MNSSKLCIVFFITSLISISTWAVGQPIVAVSGFFSTAVTQTDHETPYTTSGNFTDTADYVSDTTVGIQLNFVANDDISFTTQMIGRGTGTDSEFETSFEWLFATYKVRDNITLRAGRLRFPNYLISKTVDVGLTFPWVRGPVEVYESSFSFISKYNGVDALINISIGDAELLIQPYVGEMNTSIKSILAGGAVSEINSQSLSGFNVELSYNDILFHASRMDIKANLTTPSGIVTLFPSVISSFGIKYTHDKFFIMSEAAKTKLGNSSYDFTGITAAAISVDSQLAGLKALGSTTLRAPTSVGFYLTLGILLEKLTPYITFAKLESIGGDFAHPVLGSAMLAFRKEQQSTSIGLRYDVNPSSALKAELHSAKATGGSNGLFSSNPGANGNNLKMLTLSLDLVF